MKRTLASRSVIVLCSLIVILSVIASFQSSSASSGPDPAAQINSFAYLYGNNGSYNVTTYIFNGYGEPVQGSHVNVSLSNGGVLSSYTDLHGYSNFSGINDSGIWDGQQFSTVPYLVYNFTNSTGSSELSFLPVLTNQSKPYFYSVPAQYSNGDQISHAFNSPRYRMTSISVPNQPDRGGIKIFYFGPNGSGSLPFELYYVSASSSHQPLTEKNMTYYGTYSNASAFTINLNGMKAINSVDYYFAIFTPNGTMVDTASITVVSQYSTVEVGNVFYSSEMTILGIFVPLMAVLSAYLTFAKDKVNGVIDSVISRPVSRTSLMLSRYLSNVSAIFLAVAVSFGISSLILHHFLGAYIPLNALLLGLWASLVAVAGMVALTYFGSTRLRSDAALIGFSVGLYMLFDLLWAFTSFPLIPALIAASASHGNPYSIEAIRAFTVMNYLNPAGLFDLADLMISGNVGNIISIRPYADAQVGLTIPYMLIAGVIWMSVTLYFSLRSYKVRD